MSPVNESLYPAGTFSPTGEVIISPDYGYMPSKHIATLFLVLFSISAVLHLAEAIYFHMWYLIPTAVLGATGEIIGWAGRFWSSVSPLLDDPFTMQIVCTIIAPTPFLAAVFIIFARITERLGVQYSRLPPRWYSRFFLTCDIISLVVQAAGGGIASSASDTSGSNLGGNIMLGGIVFQLISLIIFIFCASETLYRFWKDAPVRRLDNDDRTMVTKPKLEHKLRLLIEALALITVLIFIRSIYRTIELADGWNGRIIGTQVYFNVLDGGMVAAAMLILNIFHPGMLLTPLAPKGVPLGSNYSLSPMEK
ncbi:RTA-like protein [Abortiporus biennis]